MTIEITLKNVVLALKRISVRGEDAKLFGDAIEALESVVKSIEKARKEVESNEHQDE